MPEGEPNVEVIPEEELLQVMRAKANELDLHEYSDPDMAVYDGKKVFFRNSDFTGSSFQYLNASAYRDTPCVSYNYGEDSDGKYAKMEEALLQAYPTATKHNSI